MPLNGGYSRICMQGKQGSIDAGKRRPTMACVNALHVGLDFCVSITSHGRMRNKGENNAGSMTVSFNLNCDVGRIIRCRVIIEAKPHDEWRSVYMEHVVGYAMALRKPVLSDVS